MIHHYTKFHMSSFSGSLIIATSCSCHAIVLYS